MSLTVTLKQVMDTKEANSSESSTKSKSKSSSSLTDNGSSTGFYGSKDYPPFIILTDGYAIVKTGLTTWNEAYSYYTDNGGKEKGWRIADRYRKEVQL